MHTKRSSCCIAGVACVRNFEKEAKPERERNGEERGCGTEREREWEERENRTFVRSSVS